MLHYDWLTYKNSVTLKLTEFWEVETCTVREIQQPLDITDISIFDIGKWTLQMYSKLSVTLGRTAERHAQQARRARSHHHENLRPSC
jgi:hypothetical protein